MKGLLEKLEHEYTELEQKLLDPEVIKDMGALKRFLARKNEIEEAVILFREWKKIDTSKQEAEEILKTESDTRDD